MEDPLVAEILSTKSKPAKSIIYQRTHLKSGKQELNLTQPYLNSVQNQKNLLGFQDEIKSQMSEYVRQKEERDSQIDSKSIYSNKSKHIQQTLNGLRRARLSVASHQSKLNSSNLRKLSLPEQNLNKNDSLEEIREEQSQAQNLNPEDKISAKALSQAFADRYQIQNEREAKIDKGETVEQSNLMIKRNDQNCSICHIYMNEKERNLTKRLQAYLKERGEQKKMVYRLKRKILELEEIDKAANNGITEDENTERENKAQKNSETKKVDIDMSNFENDVPLSCFKCQYNIILWSEGRAKAMRIFTVAHNQLGSQLEPIISGHQTHSTSFVVGPVKQRTAHMNSSEMEQLRLLQGSFFDYKRQAKESEEMHNVSSPQGSKQFHAQSNPVIARQFEKLHNPNLLVSITKEMPHESLYFQMNGQSSIPQPPNSQTLLQAHSNIYSPVALSMKNYLQTQGRQFQKDFSQKLAPKLANLTNEERQEKILKKLQKERAKFMTGQKLKEENLKLIEERRQEQKQHRSYSLSSKNIKLGTLKVNQQHDISSHVESKDGQTGRLQFSSGQTQPQSKVDLESLQGGGLKQNNNNKSFTSSHKEHYNNRIFAEKKRIDKTFFRKLSGLGAFANAAFNGGVFVNPPVDQI